MMFLVLIGSVYAFNYGWSNDNIIISKSTQNNAFFGNGLSCNSFLASNLTGFNGVSGRNYTSNSPPFIITVDASYLNKGYDYNYVLINNTYVTTFLNPVWNEEVVNVCLITSNTTLSSSVYLGSQATGLDGDVNRVLVTNISNPMLVSYDNQVLNNNVDYVFNLNNITFLGKVFNESVISVWG